MSKHDKIAKLKEYIKTLVVQELKDDELDEVSTTATAGIDGTGTGHYDTPRAFSSGSAVGHKSPEVGGYKKVNESYASMMDELEKIYRPSGAPSIAKQALKDLADEYDIGRVLYAARTNEKSFMEVMDMKIGQLQSQYVNKKHIDTIKRGKKLKEVTKQEVSGLQKLHKNLEKLQKDYFKIAKMGDKTLVDREYNEYYETILTAKKEIGKLAQFLKTKEMLGEGRYHDWRNDESMTPKQKVGRSMREIRDALNELDRTVKMNLKLKTELKIKSEDYWKNTHKALTKISERLVKMANKVGNLK